MDASSLAVVDDGRGRVETHGLCVQERADKLRRVVTEKIGSCIADKGEARRVAFGKTIFAEARDLLEHPLGELGRNAFGFHAGDESLAVAFDATRSSPSGHVATKLIGFAGSVVGGDDREAHDLFLKERDAQCLFENGSQELVRVGDGLFSVSPAQVGMHHAAGDGTGTDDADFDDEVVIVTRFQTREHGHLCPALDLKNPDRFRAADHVEGCFVVRGDRRHGKLDAPVFLEEPKAEIELGEGTETQQIDFEQTERFDVVLVPLDDGAIFHGGVFNRYQLVHGLLAQQETARVDRQVPREIEDGVREA